MVSSIPMAFCFRIRFELGARTMIDSGEEQLLLADPEQGEDVRLRPSPADGAIRDARTLVALGSSYGSEAEATDAAHRWRGLLQKAFARVNIGADFGDRAAT